MKGLFGLVGLLLTLAVVGVLVKQQLAANRDIMPSRQVPGASSAEGTPSAPTGPVTDQAQQQVQQALDAAAQKARVEPDEK